jgi:hypothetical protein
MPNDTATSSPESGGLDLSGLRVRAIQQAQSGLASTIQPDVSAPFKTPDLIPQSVKNAAGKVDAAISDKVLKPFRQGLNNMGEDLTQAAETGHTKTGGQLTGPAKALAGAAGTALKWVPVGENLKETAAMSIVPPELGPEGKAFSKELQAGEWAPHNLNAEHNIPSEDGYAYHATNEGRAREISESGGMQTHKPSYGTDQEVWPDGSKEKRIYFTPKASSAWQFAPEEGKPVLLRVKKDKLKAEGTGDLYSQNPIHHKHVEILGDDKEWHRISDLTTPKAETKPAVDLSGLRVREVSPAKEVAPKVEQVTHEPVGIHADDVPRRSNVPDVDWEEQDLQDSAKKVTAETIAKDYGPKRKGAKFSVYQSHIPMEDLPSAKIVEEEDPEFAGSDWRENYQGLTRNTTPPIKVRVTPKGETEILDGNHRAQLWSEADRTHAPAWVIDERGKGIENLSEAEREERAQDIYRIEGAQPLADKLGAKVVGSVAKRGENPGDLDLRIDGDYDHAATVEKLKDEGFEPRGSSVVSPKEAKASGKPYGGPGWKRAEHFEDADGRKLDVWHDEPTPAKEVKPSKVSESGKPFDEQKYPKSYEVEVSWPDGTKHTDEVKGLNQGHALSRAKGNWEGAEVKVTRETTPPAKSSTPSEQPEYQKLFDEATAALGPKSAKATGKTAVNASGESAASQEAISRTASEKSKKIQRLRVDTRSGTEIPLHGVDAVDARPSHPYEKIILRGPTGETVLDRGAKAN